MPIVPPALLSGLTEGYKEDQNETHRKALVQHDDAYLFNCGCPSDEFQVVQNRRIILGVAYNGKAEAALFFLAHSELFEPASSQAAQLGIHFLNAFTTQREKCTSLSNLI